MLGSLVQEEIESAETYYQRTLDIMCRMNCRDTQNPKTLDPDHVDQMDTVVQAFIPGVRNKVIRIKLQAKDT
jgi:hypothetical protein